MAPQVEMVALYAAIGSTASAFAVMIYGQLGDHLPVRRSSPPPHPPPLQSEGIRRQPGWMDAHATAGSSSCLGVAVGRCVFLMRRRRRAVAKACPTDGNWLYSVRNGQAAVRHTPTECRAPRVEHFSLSIPCAMEPIAVS